MIAKEFLALEQSRIEAGNACAEYERWASEVKRITVALSKHFCPEENPREDELGNVFANGTSCFQKAKTELCQGDFGEARYPNEPITLDQIEATVSDCPSCIILVGFIRDRKKARKQYGIAKRRVRSVGKKIAAALKAIGEIQ